MARIPIPTRTDPLFTLAFRLEGITDAAGHVANCSSELVAVARTPGETALGQLEDSEAEWIDLRGERSNIRKLIDAAEESEFWNAIAQISDALKARGVGHMDLVEHDCVWDMIAHHDFLQWASPVIRSRIETLCLAHSDLLLEIEQS